MTRLYRLILTSLLVLLPWGAAAADTRDYVSDDGHLVLRHEDEFVVGYNPYALLSLQSADKSIVIVTSQERKYTLRQLYDGVPGSFPEGSSCVGRVLLSVDGEDAAVFLVEGFFPPGEDPTHHTVYAVSNRGDSEYTFMIHYPLEFADEGFQWAIELLGDFRWK